MGFDNVKIFGLRIDNINYNQLLGSIEDSVLSNSHNCIAYANVHALNKIYSDNILRDCINSFSLIHPDGVGAYLASRYLYGRKGIKSRFTGSDFYPLLAEKAIEKNWKVFFFGHDIITLEKIRINYPKMNIVGLNEGYLFNENEIINKINETKPELLVIGLGFGKQEKWLFKNKDKLYFNVSIIVGDGIRVFAAIKKRGPKFMRKMGLEWLVRFMKNPIKHWNRYIIGNPLFLYRIFKFKLSNLTNN